jgi:hypothetical protein
VTRVTESELAKRWGVTTRTLQSWRKTGQGPAYVRLGPRKVFYRQDAIDAYELEATVNKKPGWKATIKRAASALDMLAAKATTSKARDTLVALRDELRGLMK